MKSAIPFVLVGLFLSINLSAQTPPPHPRLLFRAVDVPALQNRVSVSNTPVYQAYAQCVTSASLQTTTALPSSSGQLAYVVMRSLRRMQEVAFRYQMTGDVNFGNNAKAVLLQVVSSFIPSGSTAYMQSSYPCAIAITYDMIYPLLTPAERTQVVNHLIAWVNALKAGSWGSTYYATYQSGAADNFSFAWFTGVAMSLMAIWGDTNAYPNLVPELQQTLDKIRNGWRDAISPDGSVDESYGYANYGNLYSLQAGIAAQNCGLGDYLESTNILRTAKWYAASLLGSTFHWTGDSSPGHKGLRTDPILYHLVSRTQDAESFWGIERIFAIEPVGDSTPSQAFSPLLTKVLHYPLNLVPTVPALLSSFYRDNANEGTPTAAKTQTFYGLGLGGHALMHNSSNAGWTNLGAMYMIRDEWMNHSHEDDGHLGLFSENTSFYLDLGYATTGSWAGGQSTDHNIVTVVGDTGFNGAGSNYYNPPSPNARFLGAKEASLFSIGSDYVRGSHANMWMMDEATRTVVMVKDASNPYLILVDRVRRPTSVTFEENFNSCGPASGFGTAASPLIVAGPSASLKAVWLSPSSVTVAPGSAANCSGGYVFYRNKVSATGSAVSFVSVHGKTSPTSVIPLQSPLANTSGGTAVFPFAQDKILHSTLAGPMGDAETRSDGRFAWLRLVNGGATEFLLGEGRVLSHEGTTLLITSESAVTSVRGGRIDITSNSATLPANFGLLARVPGTVSSVLINGVSVPFTQTNAVVRAGPPPTPPESLFDRVYVFDEFHVWDGVVESGAVITPDGTLTTTGGVAGIRLFGGQPLALRPVALGLSTTFLGGASGTVAGLHLETSFGAGDVLKVNVQPSTAGHFQVQLTRGSSSLGTFPVPLDFSGVSGRFQLLYTPQTGAIEILDALGVVCAQTATPAQTFPFRVRALASGLARIDDVTYFDSEEDGVTPQGVAFWSSLTSGRVGFVCNAPQLAYFQDIGVVYNGQRVDVFTQIMWIVGAGLQETLASPSLSPSAGPAVSLREFGFASLYTGVNPQPGVSLGVVLTGALGQDLYGDVNF